MSELDVIEELNKSNLRDLNFGSVKLHRALIRSGIKDFQDLVTLSESKIDSIFEPDIADSIIDLQKEYESNPKKVASRLLKQKNIDNQKIENIIRESLKDCSTHNISKSNTNHRPKSRTTVTSYLLSKNDLPNNLLEYQHRVYESLEDICDQNDSPLVYQIFDEYITDIDIINDEFRSLYRTYKDSYTKLLNSIERYLPDVFALHIASSAQSKFKLGNLWDNIFNDYEIPLGAQTRIKQLFLNTVKSHGMPVYTEEDEAVYYYYTVLLHAGLTDTMWDNLWKDCLLPATRGNTFYFSSPSGYEILDKIKKGEVGKYMPRSLSKFFEHVKDNHIASLLEKAYQVALSVTNKKSLNKQRVFASDELPFASFKSLSNILDTSKTAKSNNRTNGSTNVNNHTDTDSHKSSHALCFSVAKMELDLNTGSVLLRWNKQQLDTSMIGYRACYYVNNKLVSTQPVIPFANKCILEEISVKVEPQLRYEIIVELQKPCTNGEFETTHTIPQTFKRTKLGCFEFIEGRNGRYYLRKDKKITKTAKIAYLIKNDYRIEPGEGMQLVFSSDADQTWEDSRIQVFEVEPGACGSITNISTNRIETSWREGYTARISKGHIFGETTDGLDLYGYVSLPEIHTLGLPTISIECSNPNIMDDLIVQCDVDGKTPLIWYGVVSISESGDYVKVLIDPNKTAELNEHIEKFSIRVYQKSLGNKAIFNYSFSVIPIREFHLHDVYMEGSLSMATYSFIASKQLTITNTQGQKTIIEPEETYTIDTPLYDEFLDFNIESENDGEIASTDIRLALAAIDINVPERLLRVEKKHPFCLADVKTGMHGVIDITSLGDRYNRTIYLALGYKPQIYEGIHHDKKLSFNLYDKNLFKSNEPKDVPLELTIGYGERLIDDRFEEGSATMKLLDCMEGFGFKNISLTRHGDIFYSIDFDGELLLDAHLIVKHQSRNNNLEEAELSRGETQVILSKSITRRLNTNRAIEVRVIPKDRDHEDDDNYAIVQIFEPNKDRNHV